MIKPSLILALFFSVALTACEKPPVPEDEKLALDLKFPEDDAVAFDDVVDAEQSAAREARLAAEAALAEGKPTLTVVDAARKNDDLSTFVRAVEDTGLSEVIAQSNGTTLFIPTDTSFQRDVDPGVAFDLFLPNQQEQLEYLVLEHMVDANLNWDILVGQINAGNGRYSVPTSRGTMLTFRREAAAIVLSNDEGAKARLIDEGIPYANGIIYQLNGVLTSGVTGTR